MRLAQDGMRARRYRMARTIAALMLREMATTHGRSPGGYLWAVAEPVAAVALLSLVFSTAFHAPALGQNFPLFYATGYLPFAFFNDLSNKIAASIRFSKPLLAYPSVTFIDALLARFALGLLTHVMVWYFVFTGILLYHDTRAMLDIPSLLSGILMLAVFALGVGTLNCFLLSAIPAWERAWSIATRPLFIVSGVFFLWEDVPTRVRDLLWFNPLLHGIGAVRKGFYPTYEASYVSPAYVLALGLALFAVGLLLLRKHHRNFVND
jgi:capsular polysaccharide transport system permease protein